MGRVRAPLVVVLLWTVTAALVIAHLVGPSGPFADATYLAAIFAGSAIAWLGTWRTPGPKLVPVLISSGLTAAAIGDFIWLAYTWAGLEPDVSLADIFYYAGYLGLGAAMLVIVLQNRQDVRRVDVDAAIDALTVVTVSVLVLWSVAVHGIITDDSMSATTRAVLAGLPHHRRRAAGAGAPGPLRAPPPGGPGLPLRGRGGLLAGVRPRLPPVPGLGHDGGHPRRGLDGRRHPDRHLHVASSAPDARGTGARAGADAPGPARPRRPPAPGPPGPARRHLRPRRGGPPRRRGRRDAHPDRRDLRPDGSSPAVPDQGPPGARPGPRRRTGGVPRQVDVPRHDEPRDPHAHERRDRAQRPAAHHRARAAAAAVRRGRARRRARAARGHQPDPRLLEDRVRAPRPRGHRLRPASPSSRASPRSSASRPAPRTSSCSPTARPTCHLRCAATRPGSGRCCSTWPATR